MDLELKDRFLGCFAGLSVGDAVGFELQYDASHGKRWAPGEITAENVREFEFSRPFDLDPGQYTDDTQLTLALARAITKTGAVESGEIGIELARTFTLEQVVGPSRACLISVMSLLEGGDWPELEIAREDVANCAAKRAAPVGLFNVHRPDRIAPDAVASAAVTHVHPLAQIGAVVFAAAVALAADAGPPTAPQLLLFLEPILASMPQSLFAPALARLPELLELDEAEALRRIAPLGREDFFHASYIAPHVLPSVLASLYAALRAEWDFCEALAIVYRAQGDVDSTGAMAGGLVGAACGLGAVPERLHMSVKDAGRIKSVAAELFEATTRDE
jgi:ADP-ribosylglycohydrolase